MSQGQTPGHGADARGGTGFRASPAVWLFTGWAMPASIAALAVLVGLGIQYVGAVLAALGLAVESGGWALDWGEIALAPALVWSGFHGGVAGMPILATGLLWASVSFRVATLPFGAAAVSQGAPAAPRPLRLAVTAAKCAVVYTVLVVTSSTVTTSLARRIRFEVEFANLADVRRDAAASVGPAIAMGLIVAFALCAIMLWVRSRPRATMASPLPHPLTVARGVALGSRRVLLIGVIGMAVFVFAAGLADQALNGRATGRELVAVGMVEAAVSLVWTLVESGVFALVEGMRLFTGATAVVESGKPLWLLLGLILIAVAFVAGGRRAAREAKPATVAHAAAVGFSAGSLCGPALLILGQFPAGAHEGGFLLAGLVLPMVWGLAASIGGSVYGRAHGLPVGGEHPAAAGGRVCPHCGEPMAPSDQFCKMCGRAHDRAGGA